MPRIDYSKQGGPAFPSKVPFEHWGDPNQGMSLRDWFAGMALQGLCASDTDRFDKSSLLVQHALAAIAYDHADAMLAERDRGK